MLRSNFPRIWRKRGSAPPRRAVCTVRSNHVQRQPLSPARHAALAYLERLDGDVLWSESLAAHSTFGIGGPVAAWFRPRTRESFTEAIAGAERECFPVLVIGGGSNVLFPDEGLKALAISTESLVGVRVKPDEVVAESGVSIGRLLARLHEQHRHQIDFLAGIPGTVGGALMGNAGLADRSIGDVVLQVEVLSNRSSVQWLDYDQCHFGYRTSDLGQWPAILGVRLRTDGVNFDGKAVLSRKRSTQPIESRTAGCIFKNPSPETAGRLIEEAGLKGLRVGNAIVSYKHANFIENLGGARSAEIRNIIDIVREKVYKFHRVLLELEIEVFDGWTREVVQAKPSGGDL